MIDCLASATLMKATSVATMSIPGTVTMWIKTPASMPTSLNYIMFGNYGFYVGMDSTDDLVVCLYRQNNKKTTYATGWSTGETHFVAASWRTNASQRTNIIYTDGVQRVSDDDNDGILVGSDLYVGARIDGIGDWEGDIGDLRIYNRELTAAEISSMYAARGKDDIYQGLLERWPMAEGAPGTSVTSNSAKDLIAGNHFDTITGTPQYAESQIFLPGAGHG